MKAFPKSEEVKRYAAGCTKASCIIKEMANHYTSQISSELQSVPYAMSTDGSHHTSDAKLYPIIINYPDLSSESIKLQVLSIPNLEDASSGVNIANMIVNELEKFKVPLSNCIAMGSDNAPVMLGHKSGVISVLRSHQSDMLAQGCPYHLINIAAQKAAKSLPVWIDSLLIDLFYYMDDRVNRKQRLLEMQIVCGSEVRKILKHICTRWLSLGQCFPRLTNQCHTILKFVDVEVEKHQGPNKPKPLQSFKIPKKSAVKDENGPREERKTGNEKTGKKSSQSQSKARNIGLDLVTAPTKNDKLAQTSSDVKPEEAKILRIQKQLRDDRCRAYAHFLLFSINMFEKTNVLLQTRESLIHRLKDILTGFLKELLSCFLKPSAIKDNDPLYIDFKKKEFQKDDLDISIGSSTLDHVEKLKGAELIGFFKSVREYN